MVGQSVKYLSCTWWFRLHLVQVSHRSLSVSKLTLWVSLFLAVVVAFDFVFDSGYGIVLCF